MIEYTPIRELYPYIFKEEYSDTELKVVLEMITSDGINFKEVSIFSKEEVEEPNFRTTKLFETKQLMEKRMKRRHDWLMCRLHLSYDELRAELLEGHNTNEKTN